ncbi:PAC2 family protein [Geodermatophilus sp. DF01-2]|uniref:PAC2 family protein n=1 Tax=Geodermatophilus sp. DF01-2 TaxID=2559610 RepID=UPI0010744309|nr:PAC2 family protein [Geodermatophilus sp. DF01_2]TFV56769.1 PAC2 family protein [Geodermatophilus sp. DF01_2]
MAQRPEQLVELLAEAEPFLAREAGVSGATRRRGLVLVHDLAGEFDAASAGALAGAHLLAALPQQVIARFDADSLVDYRGHRPRMTFHGDRYESFSAPEIQLYALEDDAGEPFLLLHGVEPDFAWERFVAAVGGLVERLGVTSVVALQAIPMPVPHTRPVTVTAHATRRALIEELREAAEAHRTEVDEQIARSPENTAVVASLEQQYDQFTAGREGRDLLGDVAEVPSGEEIGAEFERFLAEQERHRGE